LKGKIEQHTGFARFGQAVVEKRELKSQDEIQQSILDALDESYVNGIQFIGDISNTCDTLEHKKTHRVQTHTFIEIFGLEDQKANAILDQALNHLMQFTTAGLSAGIAPHATYSLHPKLWQLIKPILKSPISIHHQESREEDEYFRKHEGGFVSWFQKIEPHILNLVSKQPPTEYLLQQINRDHNILLVHNVDTTTEDIALAKKFAQRSWVTCPQANLYIQDRLPDNYSDLLHAEENICIGTDSLASNHRLSIWSEICTLHAHRAIPLSLLIRFATSHGAQAFQQDKLGQFESMNESKVLHISNYIHEDGQLNPDAAIQYL
jgi:cytosine/adenosine deaminase-related metal-dependent hydrolase